MPKDPERPNGADHDDGDDEFEFDRFADLARKLVAVPKSELDAEREGALTP